MTDEERRDISNLFIVCGKHHDIIDDKNNEKGYPAGLLRKYKTLSSNALKRHMGVLEDHNLGSIDEGGESGQYFVSLSEREGGSDPWIEILEFCEKTGHSTDELIHDLNFGLYDG
jgi:hypothetical protein